MFLGYSRRMASVFSIILLLCLYYWHIKTIDIRRYKGPMIVDSCNFVVVAVAVVADVVGVVGVVGVCV